MAIKTLGKILRIDHSATWWFVKTFLFGLPMVLGVDIFNRRDATRAVVGSVKLFKVSVISCTSADLFGFRDFKICLKDCRKSSQVGRISRSI